VGQFELKDCVGNEDDKSDSETVMGIYKECGRAPTADLDREWMVDGLEKVRNCSLSVP